MPNDTNSKCVLIITYNWPPDASVGSIRPVHLARTLAKLGWAPIILTVKEKYHQHTRESEPFDHTRGTVVRTKVFPHPRLAYLAVKRRIASVRKKGQEFYEATQLNRGMPMGGSHDETRFLSTLKRFILSLLFIPDCHQGWIPFATIRALRIIYKHKPRYLITTGPPFSAHIIGIIVRMVSGVRWISDFRDPWSFNKQQFGSTTSSVSVMVNKWLEAIAIHLSYRVVSVTPSMTKAYQQLYVGSDISKWVTLSNGFDAGEFLALGPISKAKRFTIDYLGGFNYTRSPHMLLEAIKDMLRDGLMEKSTVSVKFIGLCRYIGGEPVQRLIEDFGLKDVVEIIDFLPRHDALKHMRQAHVLLLLANGQEEQIPGKTYEYLGAGSHILAVTEEESATGQLLKSIEGCAIVELGDVRGMKQVLKKWYDEFGAKENQINPPSFVDSAMTKQYEWSALGEQFNHILQQP
jgi:glycosyltransferase involved in cell wall biosynthesis